MSTPSVSGAQSNSNSAVSTPQGRHALPARPPPATNPTPAVPVTYGGGAYGSLANGYGGGWNRGQDANAASTYQSYPQVTAYPTVATSTATIGASAYYPTTDYQQQYYPATTQDYSATQSLSANPYAPSAVDNGLDAEKYAQWQSGFEAKDDAKKTGTSASAIAPSIPAATPAADGKKKTVVRQAGGKTWEDESLLEWPEGHMRIFVGNLSGEVVDETLRKAFKEYDSLSKWKVIRDKNTNKSRGFGFVSFGDPDEYFKAFKAKQGKYIGAHPAILKPAHQFKPATIETNHGGNKNRYGKGRYNAGNAIGAANNSGNTTGANGDKKDAKNRAQAGQSGSGSYGGIMKHKKKEKGGLKLLG